MNEFILSSLGRQNIVCRSFGLLTNCAEISVARSGIWNKSAAFMSLHWATIARNGDSRPVGIVCRTDKVNDFK